MADISEEDLKKFVLLMKANAESSVASTSSDFSDISKLQKKVSAFLKEAPKFSPGDIVKWKDGLKNKKYPKDGQLCIVIEELEKPIIQDTRDSGSPYYREPLDLVLALLDDDSDLVVFHYDKRRFELVEKR
jgi:hypothetical protein